MIREPKPIARLLRALHASAAEHDLAATFVLIDETPWESALFSGFRCRIDTTLSPARVRVTEFEARGDCPRLGTVPVLPKGQSPSGDSPWRFGQTGTRSCDAWLTALPEIDLAMPEQFAAGIVVTDRQHTDLAATATIEVHVVAA